jgi:hypothetical protein
VADYTKIRRGKRADLGDIHFRSSWEANVARWLKWRHERNEILLWEFEPQSFTFSGVSRGVVYYLPDFRVTYPDGSVEYLEVKGYETSKDRTKWSRMRKHYPNVKLRIIGKAEYRKMCMDFGGLPFWER